MKRVWLIAVTLWLGFTAFGLWLVNAFAFYPERYAHEAAVSDDAFQLLLQLSVPVFAFVVAFLITSIFSFRSRGEPGSDGPYMPGSPKVALGWLAVTGALAVLVIVNPGLTGIAHMRGSPDADLTVQVEGAMWAWTVRYPEYGARSTNEMVLPIHKRVRFEVSSIDVIHSFWIPGFRVKIDAVPGRTTVAYATPDRLGEERTDDGLRIQCAELCGMGHGAMRMPVRIVEENAFAGWIAFIKAEAAKLPPGCPAPSTGPKITADKVAFDTKCLVVPPDEPATVTLENLESIPHNFSVFRDENFKEPVVIGGIINRGVTTVPVPPLSPGRYYFQCDLHPIPAMRGTYLVAEAAQSGTATGTAEG